MMEVDDGEAREQLIWLLLPARGPEATTSPIRWPHPWRVRRSRWLERSAGRAFIACGQPAWRWRRSHERPIWIATVRRCLRQTERGPYRRVPCAATVLSAHLDWLSERAAQVYYSAWHIRGTWLPEIPGRNVLHFEVLTESAWYSTDGTTRPTSPPWVSFCFLETVRNLPENGRRRMRAQGSIDV
jgi:hypothetical protein